MEKQNKIITGFILILLVIFFTGCNNIENNTIKKDEKIKVGVLSPLSGFAAEHGQNIKEGIEFALKELNITDIELIYEDSMCDPKAGISAYNKLVNIDDVDIIIGNVCSSVTLAIVPLAQKDNVLLLVSASSNPQISSAGDFIFRVYPSDKLDALKLLDFSAEYLNSKNIALISLDNDYGKGISYIILNESRDYNVSINLYEKFGYDVTDFRSIVTKIKSADVDSIILVGYPDDTVEFLETMNQLNLDIPVVSSMATFTTDLFNTKYDFIDNFYITSPNLGNEKELFDLRFKKEYGKLPAFPTEYGYDSIVAINKAIENSNQNEIISIRNSLEKINIKGATGDITFDENGDRLGVNIEAFKFNNNYEMKCVSCE